MNPFSLDERVIVVTGGAGRLGRAMVQSLTTAGGRAVVWDLQSAPETTAALFCRCDITQPSSVAVALQQTRQAMGTIDVLINNAYPRNPQYGRRFEEIALTDWHENVAAHLGGYFNVTQQVVQEMVSRKAGSIINIASIYGIVGPDFSIYDGTTMTMPAEYAAIKGGLVNFTRYLATYFGRFQIRANAVSPGGVFDGQPERFVAQYERKVPLGRMATPEDICGAVLFLASDVSRYVTGHNLVVDGGWTAW